MDSESESDSDDGPYWKYAFHAKKQLCHPTYWQEIWEQKRMIHYIKFSQ